MSGHPVKVQLVEGGEGLVFPDDPAYGLCRDLQKIGYSTLVLPMATFLTGNTGDHPWPGDAAPVLDRLAWQDQRETLGGGVRECAQHYWRVTVEEGFYTRSCDVCEVKEVWPLHPDLNRVA